MSTIKLKVCGLRDNVDAVQQLAPDYMGFIFYKQSSRYVGDDFQVPETDIATIGVFVDEDVDTVSNTYRQQRLDLVQLHGDESIDYCVELKALGIPIIKVFSGNNMPSQGLLDAYGAFIDYYLLDNRFSATYGGTGASFDWSVLERYRFSKPLFLSGGIGLTNISEVLQIDMPIHAIDVNSHFETAPGLKDISKLKQLNNRIKEQLV